MLYLNSVAINLLVAFYGAFFMSVYYDTHCHFDDCDLSLETGTTNGSPEGSIAEIRAPVTLFLER
ncbi:MAG: hypothetical protein WBV78_19255 [Roseobacter sp.]|jgi:hypothetical protein